MKQQQQERLASPRHKASITRRKNRGMQRPQTATVVVTTAKSKAEARQANIKRKLANSGIGKFGLEPTRYPHIGIADGTHARGHDHGHGHGQVGIGLDPNQLKPTEAFMTAHILQALRHAHDQVRAPPHAAGGAAAAGGGAAAAAAAG
jgi:hypothetical protein